MKQSMLKSIKGFFNSNKPKSINQISSSTQEKMEPRVISFGTTSKISKNQEDETNISEGAVDDRYSNIEELTSLKELGLKKDEIQQGEIAVLHDKKFVFCKLADGKYQQTELILTNYKICLVRHDDRVFFPLSKIDKLSKYTTNESVYKMQLQLKDGRRFKFRINSEVAWKKIYDKIEMFAFIKSKRHFFSYRHYQHNKKIQQEFKGWKLYDPVAEFHRMGIQPMQHTEQAIANYTSDFKILDNKDGRICSTYPAILIVPARMPYDALVRCARFRSKQRMPALSYAYQYEKDKFSAVYRSSQSKVGVQNSRSSDDELMLRMIGNHKLDSKNQTPSNGINCKIYDARGFYAAFGNKISGKGYQSEEFYSNCKLEFLNIPNIHVVREAYLKTLDASFGEDSKFYTALAEAKWYEYIFLILYGALDLAKNLAAGTNCLVHCSDGWDRTSQLCSLAGLILDPYYRTIEGFMILIEKDWIYFGHQFAKRLGQGMNNPMSEQKSQVFLQFLDCVTQIIHQFPSQFEFNYKFIQEIGEQAYSTLYGNFLSNCYFEMIKHGVKQNTVSLWSKMRKHKDIYINAFYVPVEKTLLALDANEKNMRFWKQHFLQHVDNFKDVYGIYSCKFTEQNLQIIHKHLVQEKMLLEQKYADNQNILNTLDKEIRQLEFKINGEGSIPNQSPQKIQQACKNAEETKQVKQEENGTVGLDQLIEIDPNTVKNSNIQ